MPAYKDKAKGTWYASFYYEDWTGKKVKKMKRGFPTKRGGSGVGADIPATTDRRPGNDL